MPIDLSDEKDPVAEAGKTGDPADESRKDEAGKDDEASNESDAPGSEETTEEHEATTPDLPNIPGLSREADGTLVLLVDPDDATKGVFKGKDTNELLQNVRKGKVDAENYIRELKAKKTGDSLLSRKTAEEVDIDVQMPEYERILEDVVKRSGIDPQMLMWDKAKWREFEQENGAVETIEVKMAVNKAKQIADATYAEQSTAAINDMSLREETLTVAEMLEKSGLSADDIDYEKIVDTVDNDKKNFNKSGIRRNGRIVAAVHEEISRILDAKKTVTIKKDVETKVAEGLNRKKAVGSTGAGSGAKLPLKPTSKAPASTSDAVREILAEMEARGKK